MPWAGRGVGGGAPACGGTLCFVSHGTCSFVRSIGSSNVPDLTVLDSSAIEIRCKFVPRNSVDSVGLSLLLSLILYKDSDELTKTFG
jgi:hypothetical protein